MMQFTVGSNSDVIPAGTYTGILEAVTIKNIVSRFNPNGDDMREWHFQINVNGDLKPVDGLTSQATGPNSTAYRWLSALLRRDLKAGEQIESPVGQNCLCVVKVSERGFSKVTDVLPAPNPPEQSTLPDGSSVPR